MHTVLTKLVFMYALFICQKVLSADQSLHIKKFCWQAVGVGLLFLESELDNKHFFNELRCWSSGRIFITLHCKTRHSLLYALAQPTVHSLLAVLFQVQDIFRNSYEECEVQCGVTCWHLLHGVSYQIAFLRLNPTMGKVDHTIVSFFIITDFLIPKYCYITGVRGCRF